MYNDDEGSDLEYNGTKFSYQNNVFSAKLGGKTQIFGNLPQEIENLTVSAGLKEQLSKQTIYLTFDPNSRDQDLSYMDLIRKDFSDNLNSIVINGITANSSIYQLPIIDCYYASNLTSVFKFEVSNETRIDIEGDCVILKGENIELIKLRDYVLYTYYDVIVK